MKNVFAFICILPYFIFSPCSWPQIWNALSPCSTYYYRPTELLSPILLRSNFINHFVCKTPIYAYVCNQKKQKLGRLSMGFNPNRRPRLSCNPTCPMYVPLCEHVVLGKMLEEQLRWNADTTLGRNLRCASGSMSYSKRNCVIPYSDCFLAQEVLPPFSLLVYIVHQNLIVCLNHDNLVG